MNALQTLKTIRDDVENTKHWLQGSFANPSALSHMSARIQAYAQQLKELEAERIKDLQDNGPKVHGDINDLTITLLRDGKEKYVEISEYSIQLAMTDKEEKIKSLKLDGPPDAEGMTHYIRASPGDWGQTPWGVWITKEESASLSKQLAEIYKDEEELEDYWRQDSKCTFCGAMESECGGDHGDEMRQIQKDACSRY
jgi:hypothetical protein